MTAAPFLHRVLRYGLILGGAVLVLSSIAGLLVDGLPGLLGGVLGSALAFAFVALTAVSVLIGMRASGGTLISGAFFGIVLGGWLLKFIAFLVVALLVRGSESINPVVTFVTIVVAVIGSLAADMIALQRSRIPYVSDVSLPGDQGDDAR